MSFIAAQSFVRNKGGDFTYHSPVICRSEDEAIRRAGHLAKQYGGAVAFVRNSNVFDEYEAPVFVAAFGHLPEEVTSNLPEELAAVVPA